MHCVSSSLGRFMSHMLETREICAFLFHSFRKKSFLGAVVFILFLFFSVVPKLKKAIISMIIWSRVHIRARTMQFLVLVVIWQKKVSPVEDDHKNPRQHLPPLPPLPQNHNTKGIENSLIASPLLPGERRALWQTYDNAKLC